MKRKKKYYLILSSSSKARKNLLEQIKIPHTSFCPKVNENPLKNEKPKDLVKRLSILKVKEAKKDHKNCFILAADTVVYARKQFINKTLKRDIAYNNIKLLSGRRHTVYTGLAFMLLNGDIKYYLSTTKVKFKLLSEKDILEYLKSNEYTLHGRGRSRRRTEIVVEEVLDAVCEVASTKALAPYLILRRHPKETEQDLRELAQEFDYISTKGDPIELVHAADLVVGMSSILLNEAHLSGIATLAVVPRKEEIKWLPSVRAGEIPCVTTASALRETLNYLVNSRGTKPIIQLNHPQTAESFTNELIRKLLQLACK